MFNLFDGAVSWMSRRDSVIALSNFEDEYMVATHACKEFVWLYILCLDIGFGQHDVRLDCDSQSAIFLTKNPTYHSKMKHINVQFHFVREKVENQKVLLEKVDIIKNVV